MSKILSILVTWHNSKTSGVVRLGCAPNKYSTSLFIELSNMWWHENELFTFYPAFIWYNVVRNVVKQPMLCSVEVGLIQVYDTDHVIRWS